VLLIFKGHTDIITNIEIPKEKNYFLTTSKDLTFRFWSFKDNQSRELATFDLEGITENAPCVAFESSG